jgi:hypothetical protein
MPFSLVYSMTFVWLSTEEIQNAWNCTYPPRIRLHGVVLGNRNDFSSYAGFTLFWQASGELRCRVHPTSPRSALSITSLSLPSELPAAPPVRDRLRRETRTVASRYLTTACRRRNLSALEPPQLTCSRLQLAQRPQSKHGVRVNLLPLGFDK